MEQMRKLGEILVERQILCTKSVERIVATSVRLKKRSGKVLEEMGLVTEEELALALATQYNLKVIFNFAQQKFSPELLKIIPAEVALQNTLFPLKREGGELFLAIADPTYVKVINNIAANNGLSVKPVVSTTKEINEAICKHYYGKEIAEPAGKTVLIVDDDKTMLTMIHDILSKQYRVITALDGLEAFKEVVSKRPQVVITDKEMPKLDGFALLNALRAVPDTKQLPVILLSGTTSDEEEALVFEKGFFDYIQKPVKQITLLARVKRAFDFYEKQNHMFLR